MIPPRGARRVAGVDVRAWRGGLLDVAGNAYVVVLLGFTLAFGSMGVRLVRPEPPPAR